MNACKLSVAMCLALAAALVCLASTAWADDRRGFHVVLGKNAGNTSYAATITTNGRTVWIDVQARQAYAGQYSVPTGAATAYAAYGAKAGTTPGAGSGTAGTAGRSWTNAQGEPYYQAGGHTYHLEGIDISFAASGPTGWYTTGSRAHPGEVPVGLVVDGTFQGIIWIPPGNLHLGAPPSGSAAAGGTGAESAPVVVDPRVVALEVLQQIGLPNLRIGMNPRLGLVGMPGWFWGQGYNGQPFGGSATVGDFTVAVQVQPTSYTWSFGDGATLVSHDLGQPYPAESDIQHTYQYSSLGFPGGFPVQLTIQFVASYSVNGGLAETLSTMEQTYATSYRVQEVQSILTGH